jgi:hypothetical protein
VNPGPPPLSPPVPWLRPGWFLAGLGIGLAALGGAGWLASRTDYHPGFVRFHPMISPEDGYYPTLDEMCAIVRSRCRPDQILVIVGGNSILLGVWQPEAEVWTRRLQELLGDHYCVLNFAFRGGSPTDGGAVVAEALRAEFPRQILVANEAAITAVSSFGREPYRYLFWQAYFGGRLLDSVRRTTDVELAAADQAPFREQLEEVRLSVWFDRVLHYHDLWNWITFQWFGTLPSRREPAFPGYLRPRRLYRDTEVDGANPAYAKETYKPESFPVEMQILRGPAPYYQQDAAGRWELADATRRDLATHLASAFPDPLKARTLVLLSQSSPFYRRHLTPRETELLQLSFDDSVQIWREAGYPCWAYGADFVAADYGDRIHLTKLGGWKLAAQVAPEVATLSRSLGYLP